jgi:predicted GNAT superfamily acetyltransferase
MNNENINIEIREIIALEEFQLCSALQKEVFALPDIETSPVRHFVITKNSGGFILGAFLDGKLIGFGLSMAGIRGTERFFYSHLTAVLKDFQNHGIGAKLKWAQRDFALAQDVNYIKWTFQPILPRNAFFNLNRLGATISHYAVNFYGTDYPNLQGEAESLGLESDRLFAEWNLNSEKVKNLAKREDFTEKGEIIQTIEIPTDWQNLVKTDLKKAVAEQERVKHEFQTAFEKGLVCRAFERSETNPKYLLYKD